MADHCVSIGYGYDARGGYVCARCSCGWVGPARAPYRRGVGLHREPRGDAARLDALGHVGRRR